MNRFIWFYLFFFIASVQSAVVLQAQTGGIEGVVIDEEGLGVIGANILLDGYSGKGTITDIDGHFLLSNLKPGTYSITISYISHQKKQISDIVVKDQAVQLGTVKLLEATVEMNAVLVTAKALRNTETAIQTLQRRSLVPVDGISSQTFSANGDGNAGAAMKRITGVSVEGGKYVFVRGLGGRYSLTTLNGLSIPGLDPDRNTVQMDIFPTNILDNIVVYKAFSPDLPGSFTGGLVDVRTKDFPSERSIRWSVKVGYNPRVHFNEQFLTHQGGSRDWLGVDDGLRQIPQAVLDADAFQLTSAYASTEADQAGALVRSFNNKTMEPSTMAPMPDMGLSFSLGEQVDVLGKPLGFILALTYDHNFTFYEGGDHGRFLYVSEDVDSLGRDEVFDVSRSTENVLLGGIFSATYKLNDFNKVGITLLHNGSGTKETREQGGYVYSENLGYQERFLAFTQRGISTAQLHGSHAFGESRRYQLHWAGSYNLSKMSQPDLRFLNNAYEDLPGGERTYAILPSIGLVPTRYWRNMDEQMGSGKIDVSRSFRNWTGKKAKVKAGGAYDYKARHFDEHIYQFESLSNSFSGDFNDYFSDEHVISDQNPNGIYVTDASNPKNTYYASSYVLGAYVMTEMPLTSSLRMVGGLRAEKARINFQGYEDAVPVSLLDDLDFLPAVGLIYEWIPDKMNLRFSYNRTLARPVFREISDVAFYEFLNNNFLLGNPNLKRTRIDNLDLRWEYFISAGEKLIFSAFYKDFTNPIELANNPEAKNGEWVFQNVDFARVSGIEMEFRKRLTFIDALRDFSAGGNLSLIRSTAGIPANELENIRFHDPEASDSRPLFGQAPYLVNAFIAYGNERGTQAQLSYNVQGPSLFLVQVGAMPDVYEQPFHQLNFTFSQRLGHFSLSFSAANLLDSTRKRNITYHGQEYIFQAFQAGHRFSLGLSYEL